jgi:hypothetical protein
MSIGISKTAAASCAIGAIGSGHCDDTIRALRAEFLVG